MSAWRPTPSPLAILGGWPAWREPLFARSGTLLCHPSSPGAAGNRGSASPGGRLFSGGEYFILAACIFMVDKIEVIQDLARITKNLLVITNRTKIFPITRHDTSLPCCHWDDCVIGMPPRSVEGINRKTTNSVRQVNYYLLYRILKEHLHFCNLGLIKLFDDRASALWRRG